MHCHISSNTGEVRPSRNGLDILSFLILEVILIYFPQKNNCCFKLKPFVPDCKSSEIDCRVGIQKWEYRSGNTKVGIQKWEYRSGNTEVGIQKWEYKSGNTKVGIQKWEYHDYCQEEGGVSRTYPRMCEQYHLLSSPLPCSSSLSPSSLRLLLPPSPPSPLLPPSSS